MEKKNDRNKNTSQNKLYSDEIKEMERLSEEQEKALRERRQARKHRIKKQERRKKMIVLGSMAVVTVVVAVSAVTGIVSFVTRESRQSQVSSKKSAEKDSSEPTLTDSVKQSRSDLEVDERTRRKFWQMRSFSQYNMIMTRQSACFRNTVAIKRIQKCRMR